MRLHIREHGEGVKVGTEVCGGSAAVVKRGSVRERVGYVGMDFVQRPGMDQGPVGGGGIERGAEGEG